MIIWTELDAARLIIRKRMGDTLWAWHPDAPNYRYYNPSRNGKYYAIQRERHSDGLANRGYIVVGELPKEGKQ